ncbi:MAG: TonB-dependent receptor [Aquificae bacterium]|nr:TonB-dependent receptor [Aquificota bacterium]
MKKLLIAALLTGSAHAYQIGNLPIETAYGTGSALETATSPVDLITGEEVEEKHPFDLREIIFNRNGFAYSSNGGFGQITSVYLWGTFPRNTVVMVDGIRVNDFTTPNRSATYEHLLLENVGQIEVIKGIQSGVWGADAVGGVINIITKRPEDGLHLKTEGLLGDYNTKKAGITLSYGSEKLDFILGYYWFKTSGFSAAEPIKGSPDYGKRWDQLGWERDPYRNETINLKMGWNITPSDRFEAVVRTIDAVIHYDAGAGIDAKDYDDPFGFGLSEYFNHYNQQFYKVQYDRKFKNNSLRAYFSKSVFSRTQYGGYEGEYREYTVKDRIDHRLGFVNLGFTRTDYKLYKSGGNVLDSLYHGNGYYITSVIKLKNTVLHQSLRHDSYSAFKDKTTWKLGVKRQVWKGLFLRGNWGTGYTVPSPDQLYNPWWGNPDLKPENSLQWDIGLEYGGFQVSYFKYSIKNLIDYDFALWKYVNIEGKTKIHGVDGSYSRFIKGINTFIRINYTYLYGVDNDGNRLPRRPLHQIGFDGVWHPSDKFNVGISGVYVDKRKDWDGSQTGYYTVLNGFVNLTINKYLKGFLKVENITDKYYQTVNGYATAGRSLYAGVQLKW